MSKPAAGTFCWFECASTDAASAKPFYTSLFDWNAEDRPMPGGAEAPYTILRVGDADTAGLYQMTGRQFEGVPSHWATYVKVESADEVVGRVSALGGRVPIGPMDVAGVGRIAFLEDPTGASIGIFEPGEHPGAGEPTTRHGAMGWSELSTTDTGKAKAFYCELFGWTAKEDGGGHTEFRVGKRSVGGMAALPPEKRAAPPSWLPFVAVDDCDACAAKVSELGGRVLVPPTDVPQVGRFSVFADPAGACLAFIHLTV